MRRLALVALFVVACGATPAHAQALALGYHKGDVHKFSFHSTATEKINTGAIAVPVDVEFSALETVTVQSVDSNNVADLSITLSNVAIKTKSNGTTNTTTGPTMPAMDLKIGADGRLISINGMSYASAFSFGGMGIGAGGLVSAVLPDTPVKPGDTWSKDYDQTNPLGSGSVNVTTKSKYLRDESLRGVNAAVVETTSTGAIDITIDPVKLIPKVASPGSPPPDYTLPPAAAGGLSRITIKGTTDTDVTTWIDPNGRLILKSHMTGKTTANVTLVMAPGSTLPIMPGPMSVTGSETVDLLPA
jgi:hypothetical protein